MQSFTNRAKYTDCYDITNCDWKSKGSIFKYFITGKAFSCFKLAEKWAPEAVKDAYEGLACLPDELPQQCRSCASEVAKKMGATNEQAAMVAGFAGGLGLSGNACGALSAAIWMNTLSISREPDAKVTLSNPKATKTLEAFFQETEYEFQCKNITGKSFNTIDEHTEFIESGGCENLIDALAKS
nr:C_GCAxxG_C_C family protein [Bacteroidota bacterium]